MTYDTIPIPQFSFYEVPERDAEVLAKIYFQSTYNIFYNVDVAKEDIRSKILMSDDKDDRIVMLSYLINRLTERILTLPEPRSDLEKSVRQQDTIPTYTTLLHFLYRLIKQEGIDTPTNLFDTESYRSSQTLLFSINDALEQYRADNPTQTNNISRVQEEIKKSNKFLWLGKEDWAKIFIGQLITACIKESISPVIPKLIKLLLGISAKVAARFAFKLSPCFAAN